MLSGNLIRRRLKEAIERMSERTGKSVTRLILESPVTPTFFERTNTAYPSLLSVMKVCEYAGVDQSYILRDTETGRWLCDSCANCNGVNRDKSLSFCNAFGYVPTVTNDKNIEPEKLCGMFAKWERR